MKAIQQLRAPKAVAPVDGPVVMADLVEAKMCKLDVTVDHIDWWETPKSRSVYYRNK